jgi:hypothetical protein
MRAYVLVFDNGALSQATQTKTQNKKQFFVKRALK